MSASNRFERPTFESPVFLNENLEAPKIKPGGSSSSDVLNRFFESLCSELALHAARANQLALRADRVGAAASAQSAALLGNLQSLSTRIDAASGYTQVLCDMHSALYVDTVNSTADISYDFGQATLPISSTVDLMVKEDVFGNLALTQDTEVSYAYSGSTDNPDLLNYTVDPDALNMLTEQQEWILDPVPVETEIWTKIKVPLQYRGLTPNVIELWPLPAFAFNLLEVAYQLAGDTFSDTWYPLDISYLPNYDPNAVFTSFSGPQMGAVRSSGPVRIHMPNVPVSQIRIRLFTRLNNVVWGWSKIKIYHREYAAGGQIVVQDPYNRLTSQPVLRGKDPSSLSLLTIAVNGSKATVNLTSTDTAMTPVLTGVILSVT